MLAAVLILSLGACFDGGGADADVSEHPCFGNRTDALWHDDDDTAWVGCGSTTEGYGLFRTTDGGASWEAPSTEPAGIFDDFRVSSIHRAADGLLYVAGTDTGGGDARAIALADDGSAEVVYASQGQTWSSFHVGTFRRNSSGKAAAESLTGADITWRPDDQSDWESAGTWSSDGGSHQLLDMILVDDGFVGCGSTISEPPQVFLPPEVSTGMGFTLQPVEVGDHIGELWGLSHGEAGLVAGGVDQDRDVGMVYVGAMDAYDPGDWRAFDLSTLLGDEPTWTRGVCQGHGKVVAVGEYSRLSDGLVLVSRDGGDSFVDHTPDGAPSLHKCALLSDGAVAVAGAEGYYARIQE